jgi:predicted deacylase
MASGEIQMALTKVAVVDKIEVLENNQVQVRTVTRIMEDGIELSSSFHRHVCAPDCDTTNEDAKVIAICAAVHTDEVKAAYAAKKAAEAAAIEAANVAAAALGE